MLYIVCSFWKKPMNINLKAVCIPGVDYKCKLPNVTKYGKKRNPCLLWLFGRSMNNICLCEMHKIF